MSANSIKKKTQAAINAHKEYYKGMPSPNNVNGWKNFRIKAIEEARQGSSHGINLVIAGYYDVAYQTNLSLAEARIEDLKEILAELNKDKEKDKKIYELSFGARKVIESFLKSKGQNGGKRRTHKRRHTKRRTHKRRHTRRH